MMSIRSLADFNESPPGGAVTGSHRHRHRPGLKLPADTTNEGWGLLTGHQRGPRPGHTRGLSHGHGQYLYIAVPRAKYPLLPPTGRGRHRAFGGTIRTCGRARVVQMEREQAAREPGPSTLPVWLATGTS